MQKLTKKDLETLWDVAPRIRELFDELETERELFTGKVQRLVEQIAEAKEEAREVMDDAALAAEEYYDNRSDNWRDGDKGQAYCEWKDRLREIADAIADDIEAPEVADIDVPHWVDDIAEPDFAEFEG